MKRQNKYFLFFFLCFLLTLTSFCLNPITQLETNTNQNLLAVNQNTTTHLKNLAVFIQFQNSNAIHPLDDAESVKNAYKIFNSDELFEMNSVNGIIKVPSFKKYYEQQSYKDLSITTEIFPKQNGQVVSYKDPHPIGYYLKYNEQNQIGYKDKTESLKRETELINNAVSYISNMVSSAGITADELDANHDGIIDAISFIIEGQTNLPSSISWNDLLWSHKLDNTGITQNILGKRIISYTLLYAEDYTQSTGLFSLNRGTYGTIIHEFGHTLGYMDLYRYNDPSSQPVGFYDIMGNTVGSNPQNFLTYYISEYRPNTNWHNPLPVIKQTTSNITISKPNFIDKNEKRAVKIQIDENMKEYFIVEYHEKQNTYESYSADSSGIIIYRVNENNKYMGNTDSSNQGKNDHVYIFRPNETSLGAGKGNLSAATLNRKRPTFGKKLDWNQTDFDPETIFFSDGSNSGIEIEVTNESADSITFNVTFPTLEGAGTKENPYLISNIHTFFYVMSLSTKNKYYKLTTDLDFQTITEYPLLNFEGNLDGNNKTIRNIKTNGSGLFNNIGNYQTHTTIQNLTIENITAHSVKGNYLGGFANVAENITINNVHLKSGTVKNEGNSLNDLVSTGGFIGNVNNTTIIENCSVNVNVSASKNVGGFIGINMNAKMKNSFFSGSVTGNSKVGGFIGLQSIQDTTYQIPENVYYKSNETKTLKATGGYASILHNLNTLNEANLGKGITMIFLPTEITISQNVLTNLPILTNPNTTLTYTITAQDTNIVRYINNKLEGLKQGNTIITVAIPIGKTQMKLTSNITVKNPGNITENEVLSFLGLTKKGNYVIGFSLGTHIKNIKNKILSNPNITLKSFTNQSNIELNDGIIATGMKFTLLFNNQEYHYIIVILGDVNGDGLIYATDYVKVRNHIMGKSKLTGAYLMAADINHDSYIYATDYVQIRNHIMGKKPIVQK